MNESSFEYKRAKGDEDAEWNVEEVADQGKWNQFNQPEVEKRRIAKEKLEELDKKHFDKKFETSAEEIAAHQDYEQERDELDES